MKDAFLQAPQDKIIGAKLYNTQYLVLCNLPGQRLGVRAWTGISGTMCQKHWIVFGARRNLALEGAQLMECTTPS